MVPISSRIRLPSLPYLLTDTQWTCATYSVSYQKKLQGLDALGGKHFAFLIIGKYLAGIPASKNSTQENHSEWNLGIRKQFDCVL